MGVWIRSQNKCRLVECTRFGVSNWFDGTCNVLGYNCNGDCILGEYESEEKAIKVLDMIQKHIETHSNNVFQMPRDIIIDDDEAEV